MSKAYQNPQPKSKKSRKDVPHVGDILSGSFGPQQFLSIEQCTHMSVALAAYKRGELPDLIGALGALGIDAKSVSHLSFRPLKKRSQKRRTLSTEEKRELLREARRRRFALQEEARRLLRSKRRKGRKGKYSEYRVAHCMERAIAGHTGASVTRLKVATGGESAVYRHMQTCGSVWHCAACAARISEFRRKELKQAVELAEALGYRALLCTFTARHHSHTKLRDQLKAMSLAYQAVWAGDAAIKFKAKHGMPGGIRSLETTHGELAGWHPHIHAIYFVRADADTKEFEAWLRKRWEVAAKKHGLTMNKHGFDCRDSSKDVADYIAKWGKEPSWREADELTRWHAKRGKNTDALVPVREQDGHYAPQQLLEFSMHGDTRAGQLWVEFALVYHGKRQLFWSHGLRKLLGMGEEKTDAEIVEEAAEDVAEEYTLQVSKDDWGWIKRNNHKVELLELVEDYGADQIVEQLWSRWGVTGYVTVPRGQSEVDNESLAADEQQLTE